jgi:hypothetical protein
MTLKPKTQLETKTMHMATTKRHMNQSKTN